MSILNVYSPQCSRLKAELWEEIHSLISSSKNKWIIFADFNVVRSREEKTGVSYSSRDSHLFNDFISKLGLHDFAFGDRRYTRFDKRGISIRAEQGNREDLDVLKREEKVAELMNLDQIERNHLKQKSKIKWTIEGDENSSFFHMTVNKNLRKKRIVGLLINGEWDVRPDNIKLAALQHFADRFSEPQQAGPSFNLTCSENYQMKM